MEAMKMKVKVILRHFEDGNVIYKTPPHLVNKIGEVIEYQDDAYETSCPTGHEQSYFLISFDGQEEWINSAFVTKENDETITWEDLKKIPHNYRIM